MAGQHPTAWPARILSPDSLKIQRAAHRQTAALENVGVDHRRPHVLVPQQFLDGPDVVPGLEQVGGKGVPQGVRGHALGDARFLGRLFDGPLQAGRVNVMAADLTAAGVHRTLGRREEILPDELTGRMGVLSFQRIG